MQRFIKVTDVEGVDHYINPHQITDVIQGKYHFDRWVIRFSCSKHITVYDSALSDDLKEIIFG